MGRGRGVRFKRDVSGLRSPSRTVVYGLLDISMAPSILLSMIRNPIAEPAQGSKHDG